MKLLLCHVNAFSPVNAYPTEPFHESLRSLSPTLLRSFSRLFNGAFRPSVGSHVEGQTPSSQREPTAECVKHLQGLSLWKSAGLSIATAVPHSPHLNHTPVQLLAHEGWGTVYIPIVFSFRLRSTDFSAYLAMSSTTKQSQKLMF
jgi:hypothetical protein